MKDDEYCAGEESVTQNMNLKLENKRVILNIVSAYAQRFG